MDDASKPSRSEINSTKVLIMPKPKTVKVTDPEVTGVDPVPDETEPFLATSRSKEETAEFEKGFDAGSSQRPNDATKE
jgi:hypothetical protein